MDADNSYVGLLSRREMLLVSIPAFGHALPLLALALELSARAHQVWFATSAFFVPLLSQHVKHSTLRCLSTTSEGYALTAVLLCRFLALDDGIVSEQVAEAMLLSGTFMEGTFMLPALKQAVRTAGLTTKLVSGCRQIC